MGLPCFCCLPPALSMHAMETTHPELGPAQAVGEDGGVAQGELALPLAARHDAHVHHAQQVPQQLVL